MLPRVIEYPEGAPACGIYPHVPFAEYLNWPLASQSTLKEGRNSMRHLKAALDGERVKVPTDDMILGSALHTAFLEPARMLDHVALWKGERRAGNEWKAFQQDHRGKAILTKGYHTKLLGMIDSLRRNPVVREWVSKIEDTEVSAVGEVEGVRIKARCDALTNEPLVDLKKVASTDPRAITRTVIEFGYHIQAHIYRELFNRDRFMLICVEGEPPFDVVAYELSPAFLRLGADEAVNLIRRYRFALTTGQWPGRCDEVFTLEPPEYLTRDEDVAGITIGGETAFEEE